MIDFLAVIIAIAVTVRTRWPPRSLGRGWQAVPVVVRVKVIRGTIVIAIRARRSTGTLSYRWNAVTIIVWFADIASAVAIGVFLAGIGGCGAVVTQVVNAVAIVITK